MNPTPDIDASRPAAERLAERLAGRLRRAAERIVLWLHRQADRRDLIPAEFGEETPVDPSDPAAVTREWLRQARLWASYNPEELLALKVGAAALATVLLALVIVVAAIR